MKKNLIAATLAGVFLVSGCAAPDLSLTPECDAALKAADRVATAAKSATSARQEFITALRTNDADRISKAQLRLSADEAVVAAQSDEYYSLRDECRNTDGFTN